MTIVTLPPSAIPSESEEQHQVRHDNEEQLAHEAAPLASVVPVPEEKKSAEILTPVAAAKEILEFWPFLLRFGVSATEQALLSWIIANKSIDLVGAYSAYQSLIGLATGLLYSSIFPVNTLISEAKKKEEDAKKEGNLAKEEKARQEIQLIWRQGILFAAGLSAIALIFGFSSSGLFKLMDQPDIVQENSQAYMFCAAPGFVFDMFYRLTARATTGLRVRKSIMVGDIFDNVIEASLSYLLLNGKIGPREMGIAGVAVAYSVSKFLTLAGHLAYMYASPKIFNFDYLPYKFFEFEGPMFDKKLFLKLIRAGIPDGVSSLFSSLAGMLVVMFCGHSGVPALVGNQAASVYGQFANFHMSTVNNVATNRIGQYNDIFRSKESLAFSNFSIEEMRDLQELVTKIQENATEEEKTWCEKIQGVFTNHEDGKDNTSDLRELFDVITNIVLTMADIKDAGLTVEQIALLKDFLVKNNRQDLSQKLISDQFRYSQDDKQIAANNVMLYTKLMAGACIGLSIISFTLAFAMTKQLATLLIDEEDATQQAHLTSAMNFLKIQGVFELIGGFGAAPSCVLYGMLDNAFMLKLSLFAEVAVNIISAVVARYGINKGPEWVFASTGVGLCVLVVASIFRFYSKIQEFSVEPDAAQSISTPDSSLETPLLTDGQAALSFDNSATGSSSERDYRAVHLAAFQFMQRKNNDEVVQDAQEKISVSSLSPS